MPKKEAWAVCRFKRGAWQKRGGAVILRKVDTPMYTMTDDWNYSRLFLDAIVAPKWVFFSKKNKNSPLFTCFSPSFADFSLLFYLM